MKCCIDIDMDNAAFLDGDDPEGALASMLHRLADALARGTIPAIVDDNGNTCGRLTVTR